MSIATEITRLQGAKVALKTAIEGKGVQVPSSALIDAYPDLVDQIQQGGGDEGVEKKDVNFYDIDGKRLYSYTLAEARSLTALPALPDHTGDFVPLTSQGWNWSLADVKTLTNKMNIGGLYLPVDNRTHFVFEIESLATADVLIRCQANFANRCIIYWGDGQSTTMDSTSVKDYKHTYSAIGKYDISIDVPSGVTLTLSNVFGQTNSGVSAATGRPSVWEQCKSVRLGLRTNLTANCFSFVKNIKDITLHNAFTSLPSACFSHTGIRFIALPATAQINQAQIFYYCKGLERVAFAKMNVNVNQHIIGSSSVIDAYFPEGYVGAANNICNNADMLEEVVVPSTWGVIRGNEYYFCFMLRSLSIAEGVTSLESQSIDWTTNLEEIVLPSTITAIKSAGSQSLKRVYVKATTPPTLSANFNKVPNFKIYVPYSSDHSVLNAYKAATNWSGFASYMEEYNF